VFIQRENGAQFRVHSGRFPASVAPSKKSDVYVTDNATTLVTDQSALDNSADIALIGFHQKS
jgi:hypothetical protein